MKIVKKEIDWPKATENNPRKIDAAQFERLCQSLRDNPEMLKIRPIITNKKGEVLGGNQRLKAAKSIGLDYVYVLSVDMTEEQQKEFLIKDNLSFGNWDWDKLANEWDNQQLENLGLDVWQEATEIDYSELNNIDIGDNLEDKRTGAKKAIQIMVTEEDYNRSIIAIRSLREKGKYIGGIFLKALAEA